MVNIKCYLIKFFIISISLFNLPNTVYAVTVNINNYPQSISKEEFSIDVSINGAKPGINYLRVDLYKEGTTHYFGETYNGSSWYAGSDGKQYLAVNVNEDQSASASVKVRVGEPTFSEYLGPGSYKLKVRRYTASGSSSEIDLTPVDVQISVVLPSPTPTPIATPKASATPKPTPMPSISPTPSIFSSPTPIVKIKVSPSLNPSAIDLFNNDILEGISTSSAGSTEATVAGISNEKPKFPVGILFIGAGILFSAAAGAMYYQIAKKKV